MALILITHDLGVVASVTDRVIVMYAGRVVESGETREIFADPRHPYTIGLMNSMPRVDSPLELRLVTIPGSPPTGYREVAGCPFCPRCTFRDPHVRSRTRIWRGSPTPRQPTRRRV